MSRSRVRALAGWLGKRLDLALPPHRKPWAAAMRAEIDAIADPWAALSYALGCAWAAGREGLSGLFLVAPLVRVGLSIAMTALAGAALFAGGRMLLRSSQHELPWPALTALACAGVSYAAAAACVAKRGLAPLVPLTVGVLVLVGGASLTLSLGRLVQALGFEVFCTWSAVLALTVTAMACARASQPLRKN